MERSTSNKTLINNDFYDGLEGDWYTAQDHPIALLRAENAERAPWVEKEIAKNLEGSLYILDVGCGGGFLSNHLAHAGHQVTGIDLSENSLKIAKRYDQTGSVSYLQADAYALPFKNAKFDVVCAMDILEHVENPANLIAEASRVLRPGGLFFFHTFNRNWKSRLLVIKGVDWFVKNAPKNMHVYELFITPEELRELFQDKGLDVEKFLGFVPCLKQKALWKLLMTGKISPHFKFKFVKSLSTGYCGFAIKQNQV